MPRGKAYSKEFQEKLTRQMVGPGAMTPYALSAKTGVPLSTLTSWRREAGRVAFMSKKNPKVTVVKQAATAQEAVPLVPADEAAEAQSVAPEAQSSSCVAAVLSPRTKRSPQDWTPEERLAAVVEAGSLKEEELGAFLRREGLHSATLGEWSKTVWSAGLEALRPPKRAISSKEAKQIKHLEKELLRKDKALAETAALLVLSKKVRALWGGEGSDT